MRKQFGDGLVTAPHVSSITLDKIDRLEELFPNDGREWEREVEGREIFANTEV
ncbi:MAG: hypothetical protein ABIP78_08020 [Pyrinomonadaceae bacterium]